MGYLEEFLIHFMAMLRAIKNRSNKNNMIPIPLVQKSCLIMFAWIPLSVIHCDGLSKFSFLFRFPDVLYKLTLQWPLIRLIDDPEEVVHC